MVQVYGKDFEVVKTVDGWQTEYKGARATKSKLRKDCINALKSFSQEYILNACESYDVKAEKNEYFKENVVKFKRIFGFLPPRDYILYMVGQSLCLDVVKLDQLLNTPDGVSTSDYIESRFGLDVRQMVERMI